MDYLLHNRAVATLFGGAKYHAEVLRAIGISEDTARKRGRAVYERKLTDRERSHSLTMFSHALGIPKADDELEFYASILKKIPSSPVCFLGMFILKEIPYIDKLELLDGHEREKLVRTRQNEFPYTEFQGYILSDGSPSDEDALSIVTMHIALYVYGLLQFQLTVLESESEFFFKNGSIRLSKLLEIIVAEVSSKKVNGVPIPKLARQMIKPNKAFAKWIEIVIKNHLMASGEAKTWDVAIEKLVDRTCKIVSDDYKLEPEQFENMLNNLKKGNQKGPTIKQFRFLDCMFFGRRAHEQTYFDHIFRISELFQQLVIHYEGPQDPIELLKSWLEKIQENESVFRLEDDM